jgi:putative ABC transport system ATP-binding protein
MISARRVSKSYRGAENGQLRVLDGLDLHVEAGEFVAIVGPSGSGKSTLLHILGGLDVHYDGEVELAGIKLRGLSDRELARIRNRQVGFVFQSFHLVPNLRVFENVLLPAFFGGESIRKADRFRAEAMLERVGLLSKKRRVPSQLSGGERQRVAIARALLQHPQVLLCDEPTGNLDVQTGDEIIALFRQLHREGLTVLAVTHEERISAAAERVLQLRTGVLLDDGGSTEPGR